MSGTTLTRMMTETAMAARESLRAPETDGKIVAIAAAMRTETLRSVSAHTCCECQSGFTM